MNRIPIRYFAVEHSAERGRATLPHLVDAAELPLLRCFMTLLLLPTDTGDMEFDQPPFSASVNRVQRLPTFRIIGDESSPPGLFWEDVDRTPLLVFLVSGALPRWLEAIAAQRDIGVLTPSDDVIATTRTLPRVHAGLLRGMEDLREAYRVFTGLLNAATNDVRLGRATRSDFRALADSDLFTRRPRLPFIPAQPLPRPDEGRPAAYLLNRLSNNVDEPSLTGASRPEGVILVPQILEWSKLACEAIALVEAAQEIPAALAVRAGELCDIHQRLLGNDDSAEIKLDLLLKLGAKLLNGKHLRRPLLTIAAPRLDLIRGKVPENVQLDPDHKRNARVMLRAINDFAGRNETTKFRRAEAKRAYAAAKWTILTEQRQISCQTAYLAGRSNTLPIQIAPVSGQLYNTLTDLNNALDANSRKAPTLFRTAEQLLAEVMPRGLPEQLAQDECPLLFFSDLPFEWMLTGEWPVCLTRPVARIPLGLSHWTTLAAMLEQPVRIDTAKPERVLVFDLIHAIDPIRSDTDAFIAASSAVAQHYIYSRPKTGEEFIRALEQHAPDVVVLDAHAQYDRRKDELTVSLGDTVVPLKDLLSKNRVPPLWILSACSTSVIGAIKGSFVKELLARGAACVVATLGSVDAACASMFVGKLLTEIYGPLKPGMYSSFGEAFFATQYTTALLYDPLWPLLREAQKDVATRDAVAGVLGGFFAWVSGREINIRQHRHEAAHVLAKLLHRFGLYERHAALVQAGRIRPETLLFTAFGFPGHINLV